MYMIELSENDTPEEGVVAGLMFLQFLKRWISYF